jgi:hypothetical protein
MQTSNSYLKFLNTNIINMSDAEISNANKTVLQWQLFNSTFTSLTDLRKAFFEKFSLINVPRYLRPKLLIYFYASGKMDIFENFLSK